MVRRRLKNVFHGIQKSFEPRTFLYNKRIIAFRVDEASSRIEKNGSTPQPVIEQRVRGVWTMDLMDMAKRNSGRTTPSNYFECTDAVERAIGN